MLVGDASPNFFLDPSPPTVSQYFTQWYIRREIAVGI